MGVVGTVGVVDDTGAGVGGDAILVDDPFEGGAVAEAVVDTHPTINAIPFGTALSMGHPSVAGKEQEADSLRE